MLLVGFLAVLEPPTNPLEYLQCLMRSISGRFRA